MVGCPLGQLESIPRKLDNARFQQVVTARWLDVACNLSITGPCGIEKPWLARALGQRARRDNLTVICQRLHRLLPDLELAPGDGSLPRVFRSLVTSDLLILGQRGPDRLTAGQRRQIMDLIGDRHGRGSILITSQLPVPAWQAMIDEPTCANSIFDRLVQAAYRP